MKKIKLSKEFSPDGIMHDVYAQDINKILIGENTKNLIGWNSKLDPKYNPFLTDKITNY